MPPYSVAPHRLAWQPPRPFNTPPRPSARAPEVRRWPTEPKLRKTDQKEEGD